MSTDPARRLEPQTISRQGRHAYTAAITPAMGANLISFTVDGTELIHWDEAGFLSGETFTGAFNMFPTPCRLAECSYTFEGKRIVQRKRGEDVFIHGLVRDEELEFDNGGTSITSWLDIGPGHAAYEGFPFKCRFSVTHALHEAGLTVAFLLENKDDCNIPFGYGIHPFWRIQGARGDVEVRVPCAHALELAALVPTGGVLPVEGTDIDLRDGRNIETLTIDNVFWKREPGDTAALTLRAIGKQLLFEASDNFPHMIVYAPAGEPFICVENLTSTPNAPNLVTEGHGDVASMLVAAPGETVEGWIRYSVENL